jgi:hypothetical protein
MPLRYFMSDIFYWNRVVCFRNLMSLYHRQSITVIRLYWDPQYYSDRERRIIQEYNTRYQNIRTYAWRY